MAIRFRREQDGASEILTIVRLDDESVYASAYLDRSTPYLVEVCTGCESAVDFVGLYDLDGDQIQVGNAEWSAPSDVPADVIEAVEQGWESGTSVVRRLAA